MPSTDLYCLQDREHLDKRAYFDKSHLRSSRGLSNQVNHLKIKVIRYSKASNKRTVFNNRTVGDSILQKV